jgi:hypothetical protein
MRCTGPAAAGIATSGRRTARTTRRHAKSEDAKVLSPLADCRDGRRGGAAGPAHSAGERAAEKISRYGAGDRDAARRLGEDRPGSPAARRRSEGCAPPRERPAPHCGGGDRLGPAEQAGAPRPYPRPDLTASPRDPVARGLRPVRTRETRFEARRPSPGRRAFVVPCVNATGRAPCTRRQRVSVNAAPHVGQRTHRATKPQYGV